MAKVIGVYESSDAAWEAIARLGACGIDASQLSIIGGGDARQSSQWKKSLLWGGAVGAAVSLLLPGGGHLLLAGHLARAIAVHALSVTAKAVVAGAAVGGTADLLRRAGLDRRAVKEAAEAVAAGRYALALESDWVTMQRAQLEGMLACSPIYARRGWYLEDLIRRPDAERGVSELLVVEAINHLAAEGALLATLATSPLAGIEPGDLTGPFKQLARVLTLIYEHLDAFYHFKALHRFKSKFAPSFVEPEYAAIYPPRIRLRMIYAVIGAFDPGGFTSVMASKLRKLWREE